MKIFNFFLLIFFFFISNAFSKELSFIGLNKLTIQDLQSLTSADIFSKDFDDNKINLILSDLYLSSLIFDINLDTKEDKYIIEIFESKKINNIFIVNNTFLNDKNILQVLTSKSGDLLEKNKLLVDQNIIKKLYEYSGYLNTSVVSSTEIFSEDRINVIFNIKEGNRVKLNKINFHGNEFISDNYLNNYINTRATSLLDFLSNSNNFNRELIQNDISLMLQLYNSKGFFNTKITSNIEQTNFNTFFLDIYINEGERTKINEVKFNLAETIIDDDIISLNQKFNLNISKNNFYYDEIIIENYLNKINQLLLNRNIGNYEIQAKLEKNDNDFYLNIFSTTLKAKSINKISISGNSITKNNTILSYLQIEPGDLYNKSIINSSMNRIKELKFINNVNLEEIINDDKVDINFDINENKKTGNFSLAGYFSSDVGLGVGLNIKDINIFGSGNELSFNLSTSSENILFDISYILANKTNPAIKHRYSLFNQEQDISSSFGFKSNSKGIGYSISFNQNENLSYTIGTSYIEYKGHSAISNSDSINDNLGITNNFVSNFSINYNNLNDFMYPTNGISTNLSLEISPDIVSDDAFYKININNKIFNEFKESNNFVFFNNKLGLAEDINDNLKTINAFSLGGSNFKGFDYRGLGPFDGNIYLGGNKYVTSTLGIGSNLFFDSKDNIIFKGFISAGSVWDSDYTSDNEFKLRSSIGLSLDLLTPIAPLSISYAIPINKEKNDKIREFNFTLGTAF